MIGERRFNGTVFASSDDTGPPDPVRFPPTRLPPWPEEQPLNMTGSTSNDHETDRPSWVPVDIDLEQPNVARVYDYYLGGSHNFAADRVMAHKAMEDWPELPMIMQANRAFLRRAVQYLVRAGIRQFLDLGSGIPTVGNVHQIAQGADPECRVVYVDLDPVAVAHSNAILEGNSRAVAVHADLREP